MKRIKQEIKKNSQDLIESSLPEISSLDNIQIKPKKTKNFPILLAPLGAVCACIALVAILIPTLLKDNTSVVIPSSSSSNYSRRSTYSYNSDYSSTSSGGGRTSSIPDNRPHIYDFKLDGYQPTFNTFNEVAYYSYAAYNNGGNTAPNYALRQRKPLEASIAQPEDREEPYEDSYGRTHYPIPLYNPIRFSDFLYFEFDAEGSDFLAERVGNGHINALIVSVHIRSTERMLILKNGENYYSCLTNSGGPMGENEVARYQFSSHKTFDGFEIIKDFNNKRSVTCYFNETGTYVDLEALSTIDVEGTVFSVDRESIYYDNVMVISTIGEIRQLFGLNPEFEVINNYGGPDQLVYDALVPETASFTLDEFEGIFRVNKDKLYLNENELIELNGVTKIYAAEINKDSHRDLVFESVVESKRMFNIYDVFHNKYLYQKPVSEIGQYDYYLGMRDNRLVVNLIDNGELLDYGYLGYHFDNEGINVAWQNLFELSHLELKGIFEADGVTPVPSLNYCYQFNINTPYIVKIELIRFYWIENDFAYPSMSHEIVLHAPTALPNANPVLNLLSVENGVYRYQIQFSESGQSTFTFRFYRYTCQFKAVVNE